LRLEINQDNPTLIQREEDHLVKPPELDYQVLKFIGRNQLKWRRPQQSIPTETLMRKGIDCRQLRIDSQSNC
jgi:hypothetical protein